MKTMPGRTVLLLAAMPALAVDLSNARIELPPSATARERLVAQVLVEEVEKRSQLRWTIGPGAGPRIALARGSGAAEGYQLRTHAGGVDVAGHDERGMLFGAGALLRRLEMRRGSVTAPDRVSLTTSPRYGLRGHQLGYRPKTNSYDAWPVAQWEQYIRDLAVFGANAIELIPPRSDDAADSPHFPISQIRMMEAMSRICDNYGLDVWIWYPAMDKDYANPATVDLALKEWGEVFRRLPRVDHVFVPGGDPGHTHPRHLMALLEKQTENLRRSHPKAQMWVSPQSFDRAWMGEFLDILHKQQPAWLAGVVFGPQVRLSLPALRDAVPKRFPIRHYPDITHSIRAQYPVPDWDFAYGVTEEREVINPRPMQQAVIFRLLQPYTNGFLTYSEGCNDDVNKTVWSALGWDPQANVLETLREYSRYFIGPDFTESFAQGLLALERNWTGPLAVNEGVYTTLAQFEAMDREAGPWVHRNWRFQMAQYRAHYDAYTRARLLYERGIEERATEKLREAASIGSIRAMAEAERVLAQSEDQRVARGWRARTFELAEALFQSIGMQLSVPYYRAISVGRGANLDLIDTPLNNRRWMQDQFAEIRKIEIERERLDRLSRIANWTDPGPGGFYDELGNPAASPHLVRGPGFENDPAFLASALSGFGSRAPGRVTWWRHAESRDDTPLEMRYTGLDGGSRYRLRIVYAGDAGRKSIRLVTAGGVEIHPYLDRPFPFRPIEFDVPAAAIAGGELHLKFLREEGAGGAGRGPQVSEVWLMRVRQ